MVGVFPACLLCNSPQLEIYPIKILKLYYFEQTPLITDIILATTIFLHSVWSPQASLQVISQGHKKI